MSADNWTVGYLGSAKTADGAVIDYRTYLNGNEFDYKRRQGNGWTSGGNAVDAVHWKNDVLNGNVAPDVWQNTGDWVTVSKDAFQTSSGSSYVGKGDSGYYAFNYTFDLDSGGDSINYFALAINLLVDNALAAILLNGVVLDVDDGNTNFFDNVGNMENKTLQLILDNLADIAGDTNNTLTFIVNNYNSDLTSNPVGISMNGQYAFTSERPSFDEDNNIQVMTPEPSTSTILILGLGITSLGITHLRRKIKTKKTSVLL
jgi:hypothetical protein